VPALGQSKKGCLVKRADSLLAPIIKNLGIEDGVKLSRIKNEWQVLFEKPLSLHTSPSMLKDGELLINVDSAVWLHQLGFYKERIKEKLNKFAVDSVRFRIGSIRNSEKLEKESVQLRDLTAEEKLLVEDTVADVKDKDLWCNIKKAMEKSISFKRQG
jgi:hypothetical protein